MWRNLIGGMATAVLLGVGGLVGVVRVGWRPLPTVLLAIGLCVLVVMLVDYPVASTFGRDGVERRMMLRRQRLAWADVDQLTRTRPSIGGLGRKLVHGGLVAKVGRRRYLLADQCESGDEFDAVVSVVEQDDGPGAGLGVSMLPRPATGTAPTWLYRRAHWRPEHARGR